MENEENLAIHAYLNTNKLPEGFFYAYNKETDVRMFGNMKDGKFHGLVFSFSVKGREYVFEDISFYEDGKKTNALNDAIDFVKTANKKYDLTVISWS